MRQGAGGLSSLAALVPSVVLAASVALAASPAAASTAASAQGCTGGFHSGGVGGSSWWRA